MPQRRSHKLRSTRWGSSTANAGSPSLSSACRIINGTGYPRRSRARRDIAEGIGMSFMGYLRRFRLDLERGRSDRMVVKVGVRSTDTARPTLLSGGHAVVGCHHNPRLVIAARRRLALAS